MRWIGKLKKIWKENKGSSVPLIAAVTLACMLIFCGITEYMRLMIIAAGVKDALQDAVISTINDNYNEVYHAVREGYAAGYEPFNDSFRESVDKGDVYGHLDQVLGLVKEGKNHIKYDGSKNLQFALKNLSVSIQNPAVVSAGSGQEYLADASISLCVPVSFAGKILPEMNIILRVKAKYIPKF